MVTKRQVVSGVISIPLKRCLNIFGALHEQVACMDGATGLSLVRMVSPFSLDDERHEVIKESYADEYRGGGQEQAMETQRNKIKNKNDGCVVLWNADCTKGYQAHMRRYTSQPTQVFLQSLHACFDEMHVRPWSVLCFVPLDVQGHCQLLVWHDGHPHHRAFKSSIVHGWTHQRVEDDDHDGDHGPTHDALDVPKPHALPIKTCIQEDGHGEVACTVDGQFVLQDMCGQDVVIVTPATMPKRFMNAKKKKKNTKSTEHRTENDDGATEENMHPLYCNSSSKDHSSVKKTHSLSTENTTGRKRSRKPSKPSQGHQM